MADSQNGALGFRVLTANVQSFPKNALTPAEAKDDLRRNAEVADIVLLQEIADRYHRLVAEAFPADEWEVFYGRSSDNSEPIAFRRRMFQRLEGRIMQLHPPRAGVHGKRFMTYLRLRAEPTGTELHVTNLHLVARAFSEPPSPQRALRVKEWHDGIAKHLTFVDSLVETGQPVLGGGDYNRQLKRHPSLGHEVGGRPVQYAVDPSSIDLLWFIDGSDARWSVRSRELFPGRDAKDPRRHSDHGARLADVHLSTNGTTAVPFMAGTGSHTNGSKENGPKQNGSKNHGHKNSGHKESAKKTEPKKAGTSSEQPAKTWAEPFKITHLGADQVHRVDWKTRAALEEVQRRLGFPLKLSQGSYNKGVSASSHTHDLGGVVDLSTREHDPGRVVRVLREVGFAAWHRTPSQGPWPDHIHAVLVDHGNLHPTAQSQVVSYRAGHNGLASGAKDPIPRPNPIPVFKYPPKEKPGPGPSGHPETAKAAKVTEAAASSRAAPSGAAYPPRRTLDGVDTSHHQSGKLDLRKAQHAGLRWWYLKATEGETFVDGTYRKRGREARRAGLPVGAYHFARPDGGDAVKEAQHFLKSADIRLGDMLPMLDLEAREVLTREQLTNWVGVWVTTVRRHLEGRGLVGNPIIYTPFDLDNAFGCLLWVARYSDDLRAPRIPAPWNRAAIWQHSNGKVGPIKNVPGFGHVDVNAMHPDLPLSSLRVHRPRSGNDLDVIRRDLKAAMSRIEDALHRLPAK